jgi:hypothetical protein
MEKETAQSLKLIDLFSGIFQFIYFILVSYNAFLAMRQIICFSR